MHPGRHRGYCNYGLFRRYDTVLYYNVFLMGKLQYCIIPSEHDLQNALKHGV